MDSNFVSCLVPLAFGSIFCLILVTHWIKDRIPVHSSQRPVIFVSAVFTIATVAYLILWLWSKSGPIVDMLQFMFIQGTGIRKCLQLYWMSCCTATCAVFNTAIQSSTYHAHDDRPSQTSTNPNVRKFFHLIVSLVCLTGLQYDVQLLHVASTMVFGVFVLVECVRFLHLDPLGVDLHDVIQPLLDQQDNGSYVLTPIYLLCGTFLPVWLDYSYHLMFHSATTFQTSLRLYSGLVSVGCGDTAAALIGRTWGQTKWPNSPKSVEGTCAAVLAQFVALILISYCLLHVHIGFCLSCAFWWLLVSIVTSLVEICVTTADNIVLPVVMYLLLSFEAF